MGGIQGVTAARSSFSQESMVYSMLTHSSTATAGRKNTTYRRASTIPCHFAGHSRYTKSVRMCPPRLSV